MREEFEKLPEIVEGLKHCTYNESTNDYHANVAHDNEWEWHTQFVNGAWYAYQEQQKKIDALKKEVDIRKQGASVMSWHREQILDMCERALRCSESVELNAVIGEIKELLR